LPSDWARSVFALPAAEMPQANFLTPAAIISRLSSVDLLHHRFGHDERIEVVRELVSNQILWHDFFSLVPVVCFL
jgi:hypothetical protein